MAALIDVRALFQQRVAGDDALLRLARIRFAQAGMPAELYADQPDHLDRLLSFVPEHRALPVVHLNRSLNLLDPRDRRTVDDFASRFAGRIYGLVVHDQSVMRDRLPEVRAALAELGDVPAGSAARLGRSGSGRRRPVILLEYASGLDPAWYLELATRLRGVELAGICLDISHLGIWHSRGLLAARRPELGLRPLTPEDDRLPGLLGEVRAATRSVLPTVLELLRGLGELGVPLHLHLHDGHPLQPGLPDHFSFLTRIPVPFPVDGRFSLDPMFGPDGLAEVLRAATQLAGPVSATLEIHQVEGRLPLPAGEIGTLFGSWRDLTNAERMNYWLSVLADNHRLAMLALEHSGWRPRPVALPGSGHGS